jgi:hypothetical protein
MVPAISLAAFSVAFVVAAAAVAAPAAALAAEWSLSNLNHTITL